MLQKPHSVGSLAAGQQYVVVQRDHTQPVTLIIRSLDSTAQGTVNSGLSKHGPFSSTVTLFGGAPAGFRGRVDRVDLPLGADINRVSVVIIIAGQVMVEAFSSSEANTFMESA